MANRADSYTFVQIVVNQTMLLPNAGKEPLIKMAKNNETVLPVVFSMLIGFIHLVFIHLVFIHHVLIPHRVITIMTLSN